MLFNHQLYSETSCVHIPDGGIRCVTWNTTGLTGSLASPQLSREEKGTHLLHSTYQEQRHHLSFRNSWEGGISTSYRNSTWLHKERLNSRWYNTLIVQDWQDIYQSPYGWSTRFALLFSCIWDFFGERSIPSDHTAVHVMIQKPSTRGHQGKRIPSWMSKHPVFCSVLKQISDDHQYPEDPFGALADFKVILEKARKRTVRTETDTWVRWCTAEKRGNRSENVLTNAPSSAHGLSQIMASLAERAAEICNLPSTQTEKHNAFAMRRLGLRAWRSKKPMLHAVTDEDSGKWTRIGQEAMRILGTIFEARIEGERHHCHETIFRYVQKALDDIRWEIDRNEYELMATKKDSAPGPNGIPYSLNRCAGGLGCQFLFNAYKHVIEGGPVPAQCAASRTVFIPKSSDVDNNCLIVRSPDALRPLTLCNCDWKILITAICRGLQWYTMRCIHPHPSQRCISTRQMTDNIFEIETTALAHMACSPHESGILLTDFEAADPSVNHSWIFHILEMAELLEFICRFLQYYTRRTWRKNKRTIRAKGARQGCPTSRFFFCNGVRSHLPFAWGHDHSKIPCRARLSSACSVRLCWKLRSVCHPFGCWWPLFLLLSKWWSNRLGSTLIIGNAVGCNMAVKVASPCETGEAANWTEFREKKIVKYARYVGTMIGLFMRVHIHAWLASRVKGSLQMCHTSPSRLLPSDDSPDLAIPWRSLQETNPDHNFTDDTIHMILPYFPVPKAQDMRHSAPASRSLASWPDQMQTPVISPKSSTRSLPWMKTRCSSTIWTTIFSDFSKTTNENKGLFSVLTVFESSVLNVSHDDFALQIESIESMQSGNRC